MKQLGDAAFLLVITSLIGLIVQLSANLIGAPVNRLVLVGMVAILITSSVLLLFVMEYPKKEKPPERAAF